MRPKGVNLSRNFLFCIRLRIVLGAKQGSWQDGVHFNPFQNEAKDGFYNAKIVGRIHKQRSISPLRHQKGVGTVGPRRTAEAVELAFLPPQDGGVRHVLIFTRLRCPVGAMPRPSRECHIYVPSQIRRTKPLIPPTHLRCS